MDWFDLLAVQVKSLLQHHSSKASVLWQSDFFMVQFSHLYMTTGKTIALTRWTFVGGVVSLLFNMLSRFVIVFFQGASVLLFHGCSHCLQLCNCSIFTSGLQTWGKMDLGRLRSWGRGDRTLCTSLQLFWNNSLDEPKLSKAKTSFSWSQHEFRLEWGCVCGGGLCFRLEGTRSPLSPSRIGDVGSGGLGSPDLSVSLSWGQAD